MRRLQFLQQTAVSVLAASNLLSCKELASEVLSGKAVCGLTESDQQGPFYVQQTAQQPNLNLANLPGRPVGGEAMSLRAFFYYIKDFAKTF